MCGKYFMAYGNTRTCSAKCSYEQMKITQAEADRRKRGKRKKHKNALLETEQKARAAGMSYGMYTAYISGRINIER